jgi:hypothetical protein
VLHGNIHELVVWRLLIIGHIMRRGVLRWKVVGIGVIIIIWIQQVLQLLKNVLFLMLQLRFMRVSVLEREQ